MSRMRMAEKRQALVAFAAAMVAIAVGVAMAMARFPEGFDWSYTVISKLASLKHNPRGGAWLSGGLLVGMALLWPAVRHIGRGCGRGGGRITVGSLYVGLVGGVLLGIEGLFMIDLSVITRKAHELLALVTLLSLYGGVLGIYLHRIRRGMPMFGPALLIVLPLVAVGASQLALYFGQRDLGWVNTSWRDMGVPVWLSFAFWQWLAVAVLGAGIGHLTATSETAPDDREAPGSRDRASERDVPGFATAPTSRNPIVSATGSQSPAPTS